MFGFTVMQDTKNPLHQVWHGGCNRRSFLQTGAAWGVGALLPTTWSSTGRVPLAETLDYRDTRTREFIQQALDAARSSGASYADVRLTYTRVRSITPSKTPYVIDQESLLVGVRALVDGYWGFAASPVWHRDEMHRLGKESARQAKANILGKPKYVDLFPRPVVSDGAWSMPIRYDPFTIAPMEFVDHLNGMAMFTDRIPGAATVANNCQFEVQDKAWGASDGSYCTQRLYRSEGGFGVQFVKAGKSTVGGIEDLLTPAGVGWELYLGQPVRDAIRTLIEELDEDLSLPVQPIDVGRYDTVSDARSLAALASSTIGAASELDRALGYEANAGGTSYLNDPEQMLGTLRIGSPLLTVSANRTQPGGAATVQWDDEGVPGGSFHLVQDGILTGYQATREGMAWLTQLSGTRPLQGGGCAFAQNAADVPLAHTANLVVEPAKTRADFTDLCQTLEDGIAVKSATNNIDFMQLNGLGFGKTYQIRSGRKVARLQNAGFLFRSPELWKSLKHLGGAESVRRYGMRVEKGEPPQFGYHSVSSPPALLENINWIDILRRA